MKGLFITFEGIEGSGKSTICKKLLKKLESLNIPVILTKEPGSIELEFTQEVSKLIYKYKDITPLTEAYLFQADRAEHINKVVGPALMSGKVVICDRFIDSSLVYQGIVGNVSRETISKLNEISIFNFLPDVTFLFNIDPLIAQKRIKDNKRDTNKFDEKNLSYHQKVYDAYN